MPIATSPVASTPIAVSGDGSQPQQTKCSATAFLPQLSCAAFCPNIIVAQLTLQKPRCSATAFAVNKVLFKGELPSLVAQSVAVGVGRAAIGVKIPQLSARAQAGCYVNLQLPLLATKAVAVSGGICSTQAFLPQIISQSAAGGRGRVKLPKLRAASTTTSTCVFQAALVLQPLVATGQVTVTIPIEPNNVVCKAHLPILESKARSGAKASMRLLKLGSIASATSGSVAVVRASFPKLQARAWCTPNNVISAQLLLPKLGVVPKAYILAKLPKLVATAWFAGAHGVSETWVVNLKHDPHSPPTGEADVDEITTYTNYDFEQIVRNGEDYYGVGSRGVFRLGKVVGDDTGVSQTTTTTTTPGTPGTTVLRKTGLIIPWYIYPDGAASGTDMVLNAFLVERAKHPNVDVQVIVNPDNGVGWSIDSNYQAFINTLVANNCTPLAYIPTTYGARPVAEIKAEVVRWGDLYTGVVGIFYDEASDTDTPSNIAYYSEITAYAHAMGYAPICINAGIGVPNSFYETPSMFDTCVVYENNQYQQNGDLLDQPAAVRNKRCVMVYNNAWDAQKVTELVEHARWVYVSDCGAGYDTLPTYIVDLFTACATNTTTVGGTPPTTVTTTVGGAVPVEFYFKTGLHDFRSQQHKTIASAYMAGRIEGGVIVELFPGEKAVQPQRFATPRGNTAQNYRQKFPLGNKFRYYAFGIGGDTPFVLDGLGIELANMTRRV